MLPYSEINLLVLLNELRAQGIVKQKPVVTHINVYTYLIILINSVHIINHIVSVQRSSKEHKKKCIFA